MINLLEKFQESASFIKASAILQRNQSASKLTSEGV